ncbi:MAG: hypothetical protein ALAOOOJD_04529 [bacterium]|nr:hypothetical protein [bacterium]
MNAALMRRKNVPSAPKDEEAQLRLVAERVIVV